MKKKEWEKLQQLTVEEHIVVNTYWITDLKI